LRIKEAVNLGSLCVLDTKPRHLTQQQPNSLEILRQTVITQLE
jgi:hypothetical protein